MSQEMNRASLLAALVAQVKASLVLSGLAQDDIEARLLLTETHTLQKIYDEDTLGKIERGIVAGKSVRVIN